MMKTLLPILFIVAASAASASNSFYGDKARGWHWYETTPEEVEEPPQKTDPPKQTKEDAAKKPPVQQPKRQSLIKGPEPFSVQWLRVNMPILQERAIDNPSKENIETYYYAQRVAMDKAQRYAESARLVVENDPFLDENNRVPFAAYTKTFFLKGVEAGKDEALKELSTKAGLWVFFSSSCNFCRPQLFTVSEVARKHGFATKFISIDGAGVPGVKDFVKDNGSAKLLNITVTPTTVLVVPPNNYYVVSQGMMAQSQLADRILLAAESQNLLSPQLLAKINAYSKGVLTTDDMKIDVDDPKEWVRILKERLNGKY